MAGGKRKAAGQGQPTSKRVKKKKNKASHGGTQPRQASLLGLPGELRMQIYEEVLDEDFSDEEFEVNPISFKQAALCRVNKQMRKETLKLWYEQVNFDIAIYNLEFGPHLGHWVWRHDPYMRLEGGNSGTNFKEWLFLYWANRRMPTITDEDGPESSIVERVCRPAFDIVERLAEAGVAWDVVEDVLEVYKAAAEAHDDMDDFWDE